MTVWKPEYCSEYPRYGREIRVGTSTYAALAWCVRTCLGVIGTLKPGQHTQKARGATASTKRWAWGAPRTYLYATHYLHTKHPALAAQSSGISALAWAHHGVGLSPSNLGSAIAKVYADVDPDLVARCFLRPGPLRPPRVLTRMRCPSLRVCQKRSRVYSVHSRVPPEPLAS